MERGSEELAGVAALADRPVDGRRVARVMALVAVAIAIACALGIEHLLASANQEPEGARALRRFAAQHAPSSRAPGRVAVVLIDGLRTDEMGALRSARSLARESVVGELALPLPTLSRPFYHLLFTGVPPNASGVRTNRFAERARHASVMERVRSAGGSVTIVAEGLDWMRRMHGRPADGGSDSGDSIERASLDRHLRRFRSAPLPALLVVHVTSGDHSAHEDGIHAPSHRAALARADDVIARVAEEEGTLLVLSDHGHVDAGGHGGSEPEVARAPILVRDRALRARRLRGPVDPSGIAATLSAWLGVAPPPTALGVAIAPLSPAGAQEAGEGEHRRLASIAQQAEHETRALLSARRRWAAPVALLLALMALGTIKRAYGFDRSVAVALAAWPASLLGLHLALGRPLSLSAIDTQGVHGVRVAFLGLAASVLAAGLGRLVARRGDALARTRRAAASAGLAAASAAVVATAWVGFGLGPWPLSPMEIYLPLLALGAAAPSLVLLACVLYGTVIAE